MIYISTSCLGQINVNKAIRILFENGFKNIELSGVSKYTDVMENNLITFRRKYNLNYICHNHFPNSKEPFALNLASLNDNVFYNTINSFKKSIDLSRKFGAKKFGFHAGFFLDIKIKNLGKKLAYTELFNKKKSIKRFCEGFNMLKDFADGIELYIENNIISFSNLKIFNGVNPFIMSTYEEYKDLKRMIDFKLLLDLSHLKVSCVSLGLNYKDELDKLMSVSDYLHVSDNNGLNDQNKHFSNKRDLVQIFKDHKYKNRIITLEIYANIENIKRSYDLLKDFKK